MAITRYEINGDLILLKLALESLGFFASITLDDDTTPTLVTCKDSDNNTLFTVGKSGSSYTYTMYKNSETNVNVTSSSVNYTNPKYLYKIGDAGAMIEMVSGGITFWIAKTNLDGIGFCHQSTWTSASSSGNVQVACWGDDPDLSTTLYFAQNNSAMIGNQCLFVPVPLHGTYTHPMWMKNTYFLPMAQAGMRGVIQQIEDGDDTYLTNGYIAIRDTGEAAS